MASKQAAFVQPSTLDRMGALAKWIAAKAEEMNQLDQRIDRRIEHLQRSEDSLRAMFEAIREQVSSAHSVSDELRNATFGATDRQQQADAALSAALENATTLGQMLDAKAKELEDTAAAISQSTADRLAQLMEQANKAQAEAAEATHVAQPNPRDSDTATLQYAFEQDSSAVVESIRRSAVEQVERLASQAAVAVEPILARIDAQRQQAEAQLRAAVQASEETLRRRAEELGRTGDLLVDNLEKRLARRLDDVRPRAGHALDAAEQSVNQRLTTLLDGARLAVSAAEADLADRVAQLRPRLNQMLQSAQDDLVEQLARLEEHAFAMTGWLENRMTERVDALITRTRAALSRTPTELPAPQSPEALSLICYADEYPAPSNSVSVQVFVDNRSDRPRRSTAASIFH